MGNLVQTLVESQGFTATIFLFAFLCGASFFYLSYNFLSPSLDIRGRVGQTDPIGREAVRLAGADQQTRLGSVRRAIETYYRSLEEAKETSLRRRLVRAGFFSERAVTVYQFIRFGGAALLLVAIVVVVPEFVPGLDYAQVISVAVAAAALMVVVPNFALDRLGKRQEEQYRRGFPDFMDMVIMCADAGLSLEAAVAKVAEEFLVTHRQLGIHLSIMMLEVRAGKRLRDALQGFADRIAIEEARSLSTLFKQSEELGASITQTLKVFSTEMRQMRIIRAEEKANALSVKMLLPLGVFMFPVMLLVVVLSPLIGVMKVLAVGAPQ